MAPEVLIVLGLLVLAVFWTGLRVYVLHRDLQPLLSSPVARGVAGLGL